MGNETAEVDPATATRGTSLSAWHPHGEGWPMLWEWEGRRTDGMVASCVSFRWRAGHDGFEFPDLAEARIPRTKNLGAKQCKGPKGRQGKLWGMAPESRTAGAAAVSGGLSPVPGA